MFGHLRYVLLPRAHQGAATGLEQHRRLTVLGEALDLASGAHDLRTAAVISQRLAPALQVFLGPEGSLISSANGTTPDLHRPLGRDLPCLKVGRNPRHRATVPQKTRSFAVVTQLPRRRAVGCRNRSRQGLPMMQTLQPRESHACEKAKVEKKVFC